MIPAGEMNRRIVLTRVSTDNQRGVAKLQRQTIATVWAKVKQISAQEKYALEQTSNQSDLEFVIRWSSEVRELKPKDQIHYAAFSNQAASYYEIVEIAEIGLRQFLSIRARLLDANA